MESVIILPGKAPFEPIKVIETSTLDNFDVSQKAEEKPKPVAPIKEKQEIFKSFVDTMIERDD